MNLCYLICLRHFISSRVVTTRYFSPKRPIFLYACAAGYELPSNISIMVHYIYFLGRNTERLSLQSNNIIFSKGPWHCAQRLQFLVTFLQDCFLYFVLILSVSSVTICLPGIQKNYDSNNHIVFIFVFATMSISH